MVHCVFPLVFEYLRTTFGAMHDRCLSLPYQVRVLAGKGGRSGTGFAAFAQGRLWPEASDPVCPDRGSYRTNTGKVILALSISAGDPLHSLTLEPYFAGRV